jgi:hypothetical protein
LKPDMPVFPVTQHKFFLDRHNLSELLEKQNG